MLYHLTNFQRIAENKGTTFGHIKREDLHTAKIKALPDEKLNDLSKMFTPLIDSIIFNATERNSLMETQHILLAELSR